MNIFYLDESPELAAQFHNNKHVVKMIVETAQLLCTAHRVLDGYTKSVEVNGRTKNVICLDDIMMHNALYRATHVNHPSAVWIRESDANYQWTYQLFLSLLSEYTFRYEKRHKSEFLIDYLCKLPKNIPTAAFTAPPQAMPDEYKNENTVVAYRTYYKEDKQRLAEWKRREKPHWYD